MFAAQSAQHPVDGALPLTVTGACTLSSPARCQPSRARAAKRDALQHTVTAHSLCAELHTSAGDRALPTCVDTSVLTTSRSSAA
eukprot:86433-Prymnesium_polylepis.1